MYFRPTLLLGLFLACVGCGKWYGEEPLPMKVPKLNSSQTSGGASCQIDLEGMAQKYLQGALQSSDIHSVVECAVQAIDAISDKIVSKNTGQLTLREISVLLQSHILGNPEGLMLWLERLFSFRDILLGARPRPSSGLSNDMISFSEVKEMLFRVHRVGDLVPQLSLLFSEYQKVSKDQARFWELRKKMFSLYMQIIKELLKNKEGKIPHAIPKDLILKQYQLWDQLEEEIGSQYIQAGYLANHVLLGHEKDVMAGEEVDALLTHLEFVYHQVCDIKLLQEQPIWTPQETLFFLNSYEKLLEYLFSLFLKTDQSVLQKNDLVQLLELLYAHVHGKATDFVDAVLAFKKQIFGGSLEAFGREESIQLLSVFHDTIEAYGQGVWFFQDNSLTISQKGPDFQKTLYFWTTPFEKRTFVYKNNFLLTQVARVLVNRAIQAYDTDHDGKLSLRYSYDAAGDAGSDFSEIGTLELTSLISTIQKLLKGLDLLTEGELSQEKSKEAHQVWTDPLALDTLSLGRIITLLSDQLLYNSNGDQALDQYEILETTSFVLENSRAATWFFRDVRLESFYTEFPQSEEKGLKREGLMDVLQEVPTLQWYFPNAMKSFTHDELKRYVESIIAIVGRKDLQVISTSELESIFAIVRLIEVFFIRYDTDSDGVLNQEEVSVMYRHFSPIIAAMIEKYQKGNASKDHSILSGILSCIPHVFKEELQQIVPQEEINRKVFEYIVTQGEFPESVFDVLLPKKKTRSDRLRLVRLFATIFKELATVP